MEREVYMLYEMNKKSNIMTEKLAGITNSITVHEIVKQGTILDPKLCSVTPDKFHHTASQHNQNQKQTMNTHNT